MHGAAAAQRGLVSGLMSLARNLGLVTGVAALGAVFATASSSADVASAGAAAVARGMHRTFAVDAALMGVALAIALAGAWLRRGGADDPPTGTLDAALTPSSPPASPRTSA